MKNRHIFAAIGLLMFSACSTFSARECQTMDWSSKGQESALRGWTYAEAQKYYADECTAKHGVGPNDPAMKAGYDAGTQLFCTPATLHTFAASGGVYRGTCPKLSNDTINAAVSSGRSEYLENEVLRLRQQVSDLESENSSLRGQVSQAQMQSSSINCPTSL